MPIGTCGSDPFNHPANCDVTISGELFDLEKLAEVASSTNRYTFFFSSWPLNV